MIEKFRAGQKARLKDMDILPKKFKDLEVEILKVSESRESLHVKYYDISLKKHDSGWVPMDWCESIYDGSLSQEEFSALIDIALETKDKEWFKELTKRKKELEGVK